MRGIGSFARVAPTLVGALGIASCAPHAQVPRTLESGERFSVTTRADAVAVERDVARSADSVWSAIPAAFADLGFEGFASDLRGDRLYSTPAMHVKGRLYPDERNSAYLDCGRTGAGSPVADLYSVTFSVFVRVAPLPSGASRLRVTVDGEAVERTGMSMAQTCSGTGLLERMFADAIERRVTG